MWLVEVTFLGDSQVLVEGIFGARGFSGGRGSSGGSRFSDGRGSSGGQPELWWKGVSGGRGFAGGRGFCGGQPGLWFRAAGKANLPQTLGPHCPGRCARFPCGVLLEIDRNTYSSSAELGTSIGESSRGNTIRGNRTESSERETCL